MDFEGQGKRSSWALRKQKEIGAMDQEQRGKKEEGQKWAPNPFVKKQAPKKRTRENFTETSQESPEEPNNMKRGIKMTMDALRPPRQASGDEDALDRLARPQGAGHSQTTPNQFRDDPDSEFKKAMRMPLFNMGMIKDNTKPKG